MKAAPHEVARRRAQADAARGIGWKLTAEHQRWILWISKYEGVSPNTVLADVIESAMMVGRGQANLAALTTIAAKAASAYAQQQAENESTDEQKATEGGEDTRSAEERLKDLRG